jgi:AraC-like DNA-binding protein
VVVGRSTTAPAEQAPQAFAGPVRVAVEEIARPEVTSAPPPLELALNEQAQGVLRLYDWSVSFMPDALAPAPCNHDQAPAPGSGRWLALLRQLGGRAATTTLSDADRLTLAEGARLLRQELELRAPGHALAARSALSLLLVDATRALRLERTSLLPLVASILDAIDARFARPLAQRELAAAVGRSPAALNRMVRRLLGVSPLRLIEERRMVEARRLLLGTDTTIEAVGRLAGYREAAYFRRRFVRHHSVTPATWRLLNR